MAPRTTIYSSRHFLILLLGWLLGVLQNVQGAPSLGKASSPTTNSDQDLAKPLERRHDEFHPFLMGHFRGGSDTYFAVVPQPEGTKWTPQTIRDIAQSGYEQISKPKAETYTVIVSALWVPEKRFAYIASVPRDKVVYDVMNEQKESLAPAWASHFPIKPKYDSDGPTEYHAEDLSCFGYEITLPTEKKQSNMHTPEEPQPKSGEQSSGQQSVGKRPASPSAEEPDAKRQKKVGKYPEGSFMAVWGKYNRADSQPAGKRRPCYPGKNTMSENNRVSDFKKDPRYTCETILSELGVQFDRSY
ncbi:MAG: hypothetical protein M1821_006476 [Bathelium mastoideum]|nr:MAG: hypothetical protein M1821_006476 [Bathelium mastoideum]KAI9693752.1 MAG: hypothetical protein M1822_003023 [Bathelium mastoideum]